jgi:zinc protease
MQVYEKYIKGKNYVATSFVPKGQANLILEVRQLLPLSKKKNNRRKRILLMPASQLPKKKNAFDRSRT